MATQTLRIFGQNKPDAGISTNLFTVTGLNQVQTSIFIANQGLDYDRFFVALIPASTSEQPENFIAYNTPLSGGGVLAFSGIYLNSGDSVWVKSELGTVSFTATGVDFGP